MPSESLPRDRKDFFKEKKHERSDSIISRARLKTSHNEPRGFARWRAHDFRRHPGHGKQGRYQTFPEEPGHGCTPSRSSNRMVEENSCRPVCRDGKFDRNNYGNERLVSQSDWQGNPLEMGDISVNSSGRPQVLVAQRSISDQLIYPSHHHSNYEKISSEKINSKDLHDTTGCSDGFDTGHKHDKDLPWEPLKWSRSSSLPSHSSFLCHSRSLRRFGEDLDEKVGSVQPLPEDVPLDEKSSASFEETCSMKKQRIGWGQGLAKYERKKVEVSDYTICKNGLVPSVSNTEMHHRLVPVLSDRGPNVTALSECVSPATLSSFSCSSSPGLEDFPDIKTANNTKETAHCSPGDGFQNFEGVSSKLEHFELNPITDLSSLLIDLLQPEDASSGDSDFLRSTVTSKLLLLKSDVLRALEKIETELDVFESELKFLNSESVTSCSHPITSDSLSVDCTKTCEEASSDSKVLQKHAPATLVSSVNVLVERPLLCNATLGGFCAEVQDGYVDTPRIATAKSVEPQQLEKSISASIILKSNEFSGDCQVATFTSSVSLLAYNRDSAREASEIFSKLLPTEQTQIDIWEANSISCQQNVSLVKEKLGIRKCFLRFKKRVLTLKFKALQHLWKEDMRLLSLRKYLAKPQKRFDSCSKTSANGCQKQRSSIRLRFTSSAGNLTLLPTTEALSFNSKLLANSQIKLYRSTLRMPALILDEREKIVSRFVTRNGLVEDPCAIEKERVMTNPWNPKEKEVFLEMLAIFGKDFKKIASFLDHKTTADCVEFYYKNQKSESFDSIKEQLQVSKQGRSVPTNTYLVSSGRKWRSDLNAASLDILGAASVMAANADASIKNQTACAGMSSLGEFYKYRTSRVKNGVLKSSRSADILGNGAASADALSGICGSLSSEVMTSCGISFLDPERTCKELKNQKTYSVTDRTLTPEIPCNVDDEETSSDECYGELDYVDWTNEEKSILIQAMRTYGKDFVKISQCIGSRSSEQCQIFFSKARKCLELDLIHLVPDNESTMESVTNVEKSDGKNGLVGDAKLAILSTRSGYKEDMDLSLSVTDSNREVLGYAETTQIEQGKLQGVNRIEHLDPDYAGTGKERVAIKPEVINEGEKILVEIGGGKFIAATELLQCDLSRGCQNIGTITREEHLYAGTPQELDISCSNAEVKLKASPAVCAEGSKTESDRQDTESSAETIIHPGFSSSLDSQKQISSAEKSKLISWKREENYLAMPSNSVAEGSSIIHLEDNLQHATMSSEVGFEEYANNHHLKSSVQDAIENNLLGHNSSYSADSPQILTDYTLQGLNEIETKANADAVSKEKHAIDHGLSKINRNSQSNQSFLHNISHENSNGLNRHSLSELPYPSKRLQESSSDHRGTHSWSISDGLEHSERTADIKLFGQVLSHLSPSQNPLTTSHETNDKLLSIPKLTSEPFNLNLDDHGTNGTLVPLKLDVSNYSGLEGFPMKNDFSASYRAVDKQPVPSVGKEKDWNLGCVPVFPTKDQGLIDYQLYRSYRGAKVKPFTIDVKRHDAFPELQKCNAFGTESGFSQGGSLVGGGCNDISDPVAAIKLHYATAEQCGRQSGEGSGDLKM